MNKPTAYSSAFAAALLVVSLSACSRNTGRTAKNQNQPGAATNTGTANAPKRAMVRFVNAEPNGGPMDLWFGDQKAFSSVGFKQSSDYRELPAERHDFKLRFAGKDVGDPLATNSEGLSDGKHYTVIAMAKKGGKASNDKATDVTLNVLNDDSDNPSAGKAKVRLVNADKNTGEVDLIEPGQKNPVIGGVNVDSSTRYKEINPANNLEIRESKNKQIAAKITDGVASGKNYTLVVMPGRNNRTADVLRLEDGLMSTAANR